ncbi:MAG TPA: M4 family metallopeptidase [Actinoplanes sp.]
MKRRIPLAVAVATATVTAAAAAIVAGPATAQPSDPAAADAAAARSASALVAARPPVLHAGVDEAFVQHPVISSGGMRYVPYDRTYKGVPVIGGDFVVAVDAAGQTTYTSVAQTHPIGSLSTAPSLSQADALAVAKRQLKTVNTVENSRLVVLTSGAAAALAWESTLRGTGSDGASRLTVDVDARTGSVLRTREHVMNADVEGRGWINGTVTLHVTQSGSTYSLRDPNVTNLSCQNAATNTVFTSTDAVFGSGSSTDRETGCADAFYVAQTQNVMLSQWLGRNGQNGSGGAWPIRVGLNDENAYYDGTQVQIGHNTANQWISSLDVVGHELGHGIDDHTPGGISGRGTQEFVADTFGAATESFANNGNDPRDFQVGEEVNLVGSGPIRYMYKPSIAGHSDCYSSSTPSQEVHAAAGPGNHWFYLLAEGTNPTDGQPTSPTCNSTSVTGLGIQNAIKIMYNAMLMKTTASSYLRYRVWTLQAAKNLFPSSCTQFNTVKAAWNAVSVPAQSDEPTCGGGPTTPPPTGCTGTNSTDVSIPDAGAAVTSSITIAGCGRAASSTSTVTVAIVHTYRGDLRIDLVAPDGSVYNLKRSSGSDSADNVNATYTVNLSSEAANGAWGLRVQDVYRQDTGYINSWTLTV